MPAFEWVHVQLHQQKGMISLSPPTICNSAVKILTLGLMSAWAAVRIHKYQVESMSLILLDDPDKMMNLAQQEQSALAEEISDIFDIDISL
nr:DUF898 domain-containing protein [Acinetobacter baumannii]